MASDTPFAPLLGLLSQPWTPWVLCLFIVLLAVYFALRLWQPIRQFDQELKVAQEAVEKFDGEPDGLDELEKALQAQVRLEPAWYEYRHQLIVPDAFTDPELKLRSTRSARRCFTPALLETRINLRFYLAIPNILVGIGLLFTFIGLIAALYYASEGVAAPDVKLAQAALRDLLHAATFKFVTSVAGLLASILFSAWEKRTLHTLYNRFTALGRALDRKIPVVTLEQLTWEQQREFSRWSREALEQASEQSTQLKRFNTDLAVQVAVALEEKLTPQVNQATHHLSSAIDGLGDRFQQLNQGALENMVSSFGESLHASAGVEMEQFRHTLGQLTAPLDNSSSSLQQQTLGMLEQLNRGISSLEGSLQRSGENVAANIDQSSQQSQRAMEQMLDRLQGSVSVLEQGLQHTGDTFSGQLQTSAEQSVALMATMMDQLGGGIESLEAGLKRSSSSFASQLDESARRTHDQLGGAAQLFSSAIGLLNGTVANLNNLVSTAEQRSRAHVNAMNASLEMVQKTHHELGETLTRLGATSQPIVQTTQLLAKTSEHLSQVQRSAEGAFKTLSEASIQSADRLKAGAQSIEQVGSRLQASWASYQQRFEGVDDHLGRVFRELQSGLEGYTHTVTKFVTELDGSLTKAVKTLGAPIDEMKDAIEELQETLQATTPQTSNPRPPARG